MRHQSFIDKLIVKFGRIGSNLADGAVGEAESDARPVPFALQYRTGAMGVEDMLALQLKTHDLSSTTALMTKKPYVTT